MRHTRTAMAGLAGAAALTVTARRRRSLRLRSDHVSGPVTIGRDRLGVPRIVAGSTDDAVFGLGFAIAQDRLFQMDTLRRSAYGRLSELAGPSTLADDRLMRVLDIERIATEMIACASDTERSALDSFAAGVNLRIRRGSLPLEFRVLRYRPEPWRAEDSAALIRLMGWSLAGFLTNDLMAAHLRETVGDEWTDAIYAGRTAESSLVVREPSRALEPTAYAARSSPVLPTGGMSNAWAVAGERSMSGYPLLANDPHLGYTNPSIWCEASIDGPGIQVSGLTLPGAPGIVFGRTPTFAWGITAAMISQSFLYRERLSPDGLRCQDGDGWQPIESRVVEIGVKGQVPERLTIRSTPRGPLISDIEPGWSSDPISLYWTGVETVPGELDAWMQLGRCRSVEDVLAVRQGILTPTLNLTAADSYGEIATISVGRWADRSDRPGLLDPASHPPSYIPPDDLPLERNPARGWVASANNRNVGDDYPYSLRAFHEPDYRIRRISSDLDSRPKHSVADMRSLQLDLFSTHAADIVPVLLDLIGDLVPEWVRADLQAWDFQTRPESRPTLIFQAFYRHWVRASLAHRLPQPVVDRLIDGLGVGDVPMGFCDRLLKGDVPAWWGGDARQEIARAALSSALSWLAERLGSDHNTWAWGSLHTVTWAHPFGQIEGRHQRFVNVGPFAIGGDRTTVAPTGYDRDNLFQVTGGPSMRLLADLRRPERTWATNTLGQTGRPLSRHYRDQIHDFLAGRLHPIWGQPTRQRVIIESR